jgi:hypothetical protein
LFTPSSLGTIMFFYHFCNFRDKLATKVNFIHFWDHIETSIKSPQSDEDQRRAWRDPHFNKLGWLCFSLIWYVIIFSLFQFELY